MISSLRRVKRACGIRFWRLREAVRRLHRRATVGLHIHHVSGPRRVPYGRDEVLAITVVRNGALYIRSFVDHHTALGVKHIVLLDNGSSDDTVALASRYANVTVLRTDLPYRLFENQFKDYLARRFSKGRWNLCVDVDELFDFPGSGAIELRDFLRYLNDRRYTAVVAQMLDFWVDRPLSELVDSPEDDLTTKYPYYDISGIDKTPYPYSKPSSDAVTMNYGGIRKMIFGTNNGLTKAALVQVKRSIRLFVDWHHALNARVGDVTCVLRHYPFTGGFYRKVKDAAETGRYGFLTTGEYELYWKRLAAEPDLKFRLPTSREYRGVDSLVEESFLVVSPEYQSWVERHAVKIPTR